MTIRGRSSINRNCTITDFISGECLAGDSPLVVREGEPRSEEGADAALADEDVLVAAAVQSCALRGEGDGSGNGGIADADAD